MAMNGNGNAIRKPCDEDEMAQDWVVAKLIDEAHDILDAHNELRELGNPDGSASLNLWLIQFDGLRFAAQGIADAEQRARIEALLAERRRAMKAILARARKRGSEEAQGLSVMLREWEKRSGHS